MIRTCSICGETFETKSFANRCNKCKKPRLPCSSDHAGKPITPRERQVIELVSKGYTNKDIANELFLSEGTIKLYLNKIFLKCGVKNRCDLAVKTVEDRGRPGDS